jgi:hypothetical protein
MYKKIVVGLGVATSRSQCKFSVSVHEKQTPTRSPGHPGCNQDVQVLTRFSQVPAHFLMSHMLSNLYHVLERKQPVVFHLPLVWKVMCFFLNNFADKESYQSFCTEFV